MMQRVLLVDDEPNVLKALSRVFKLASIEADTCESARDALQKLRSTEYDCIVSDYRMPEMNGLEFLELASELRGEVPRVLLSGHADFQVLEHAINSCKIESFLAKPWSNENLLSVVSDHISTYRDKSLARKEFSDALADLERAAAYQKRHLPDRLETENISTGIIFAPLSKLSGDLINYYVDQDAFNFSVVDAAGYGTVAAMEAHAIQLLVDLKQHSRPDEFISAINRIYAESNGKGLFTLTSGRIDFKADMLYVCQAGFPNSYLISREQSSIIRLGEGGLPVGYQAETQYEICEYQLNAGDIIVTFSENFTDAATASLEALLAALPEMSIRELEGVIETWLRSVEQTDDVSAVLCLYKG